MKNATHNRSSWQIMTLPLSFAIIAGLYLYLFDFSIYIQKFFAPDKVFFCTPTHISLTILIIDLFIFFVPIGLLIANFLLWMVPPVRAALEKSATENQSFVKRNKELVRYFVISAILLFPIYGLAVDSTVCLSNSAIYHRSFSGAPLRSYSLSQVVDVQPSCTKGSRGGWEVALYVLMDDGISFDLAVYPPSFSSSSRRILDSLRGTRFSDAKIDISCPISLRNLVMP